MKPKISVIVPIYNTEKYLDKCLSSIINQTMQEIEIICIDDCSPDNSYLIVEKFIKQDSRVSLIRHKVNKGSGGARNTGILASKADFLASVDSDDWIKPEMMETLWGASENGQFDIVSCGFKKISANGNKLPHKNYEEKTIISNNINIFNTVNPMFWNKLWRKSLFIHNEIFFPDNLYYQDLATTPRIMAHSKHVKIINDSLYVYLVRSDSVSKTFSAKHIIDTFKVLDILNSFIHENKIVTLYGNEFLELVDFTVLSHSNRVIDSKLRSSEIRQYLRYILLLKVSYKEHLDTIRNKSESDLLNLLQTTISPRNLKEKSKYKILGYILKPFLTDKQYLKLKTTPILFFKDSNNKIAKGIGYILRIR